MFTFYSEKQPEAGEDAPPLVLEDNGAVLVGAFDGAGGAGGRRYQGANGEPEHTGAYLASRAVQEAITRAATAEPRLVRLDPEVMPGLADELKTTLTRLRESTTPLSTTLVKSKLIRDFPTTLSIAAILPGSSPDHILCRTVSAGDSRVYALSAALGLQQLSTDDLKVPSDALENLLDDSPLSNVVSASVPFALKWQEFQVPSPGAVLACSDGCFAYVRSPMHFEEVLLSSLSRASSWQGWGDDVGSKLASIAGDDATMALSAFGVTEVAALRDQLLNRWGWLRSLMTDKIDDLLDSEHEPKFEPSLDAEADDSPSAADSYRKQSWELYRLNYEGNHPVRELEFPIDPIGEETPCP